MTDRFRRFLGGGPMRRPLAIMLESGGCTIEATYPHPEPDGFYNPTWGFYIRPNRPLRDLMSIQGYILVLVAEEVSNLLDDQQLIVDQIESAFQQATEREIDVSGDLVVVIANDPDTQGLAERLAKEVSIPLVGFSTRELADSGQFMKRLQSHLFVRDLYWQTSAISNPRNFYGRKPMLSQLTELLVNSRTHVGLFGLRKMGKTSCLYQLFALLRRNRKVLLCHIDMQRIDSVSQTAEYFLWSIGESVIAALRRIRVPGLRMFGKYPLFHQLKDEDRALVPELFHHDLRQVLNEVSQQFVIAFDEIELMSPGRRGSAWTGEFGKAWRLLRGIEQEFPGRLSFLITGTNPQIVETGRFGDEHDNPIYNYFRKLYLPPFASQDSHALLTQIGHQLGLVWQPEACEHVHRLTGGHPLLVRLYGSVVHRALLPRSDELLVTQNVVESHVSSVMAEAGSHLTQMVGVLSDDYKDEYMLLEFLAGGRLGEFREMAGAFPEDIAHLKGYGLIEHTPTHSRITCELLQSWLQRRPSTTAAQRYREKDLSLYHPGDIIDEAYETISKLGHPGGFGEVYLCRDLESGDRCAIKVLRKGSLTALQRETDVLGHVESANIVRMLTSGKSGEGYPYLVMEYLEGPSLRENCTRATRLSPTQTYEVTLKLLEVLRMLHPNVDEINRLVAKGKSQDLSLEEFSALQGARHGYIHRDIKPENVILVKGRGPVLIDFNITSRAGDPTVTTSSTPGYLPLDFFGHWEPGIDLYQLGITLLQCSVGIPYDGESRTLQDLKELVQKELPQPLADVIIRLSAPSRDSRFASAGEAIATLVKSRG